MAPWKFLAFLVKHRKFKILIVWFVFDREVPPPAIVLQQHEDPFGFNTFKLSVHAQVAYKCVRAGVSIELHDDITSKVANNLSRPPVPTVPFDDPQLQVETTTAQPPGTATAFGFGGSARVEAPT